ncbi:MAG: TIGR04372 family glycosyltransferase [Candidatus Roizmanbacteria bacterium]|nr:TIGR04372 family glycosyltransferase [Candidatus Roizmanbacteria bacterium]
MNAFTLINRNLIEIRSGGWAVLFRKSLTITRLTLSPLIGGVVVLVCYALSPFVMIRFGHLYTSRIGHLCYNMDNYLAARRERGSKEWGVFKTDGRISNKAIYFLWKQQERIFFTGFAGFPIWFLQTLMPGSRLLISWRNEMHPDVSCISATPTNVCLSNSDEIKGSKLMHAHGITSPFICLHNRDSAYLDHYGSDGNVHDYRDFDFSDFEPAIQKITASGTMAVRLGEMTKSEYRIENPKFVSITGPKRSDFSDVYLIEKCQFFVGGATGFSSVSSLFRKPQLLVNYTPFRLHELSAWAADSLVVPKKLYKTSESRYLHFSEMAALSYDIHYKGDFFGDLGLRVVDNSPEEIADAIVEMQARITGKWFDSVVQQQLQDSFWDSVSGVSHADTIRHHLRITLSSTFLERNQSLI